MKHRIVLSIALAVSVVLVSMTSSDSAATAERPRRFRADTGLVTLGPNQVLRVTAGTLSFDPNMDPLTVRLSGIQYVQGNCNGGVCKHASANSNPVVVSLDLMPGEAASMDITPMPNSSGVRGVIWSNRRNVVVTATIINTVTGETTSQIVDYIDPDE